MAEDSLVLKLAAEVDGFQSDLQGALGSWNGFLGGLSGGKGIFAGVSLGIAAIGSAAFGLAKAAANTGDELGEMSEKTGVAVRDLSLLKFAAEQSDTNIQTLANGFKFLSKSMVEAQDPGSKQAAIFDAIGVSTKNADGSLRPMKDVLLDVADRFKEIEDPTLKSALAMDVFGKSGVDLVPFLNQGGDAIVDLMAKGESLGAAWDELSAKQADDFNNSLAAMQTAAGSLAKEIGVAVMPAFTTLMNFLTEIVRPIFGWLKAAFLNMAASATDLASAFAAVWLGATKVSDALGITTNASQGAKELFDALRGSADDLRSQAFETFDTMVVGAFRSKEETKSLRTEQAKLTDEQKKAVIQTINRDKIEAENAKKAKQRADQDKQHKAEELKGQKALKEAVESYGKSQEALARIILENALNERREIERTEREYGLAQEAMGRAIQERARDEQDAIQRSRDDWNEWFDLTKDTTGTFKQFSFETFQFVKQGFGDAVAGMILHGDSLKESLKAIWNRILESFISMLVQMGVEYVAQHTIMQTFAATNPIIQPTVTAPVGGPGAVPGATGAPGAGGLGTAGSIGIGIGGAAATVDAANRARDGDSGDVAMAFVESPIGAQVGLVLRAGDAIFGADEESDNQRLARHFGRDRVAMNAAKRRVGVDAWSNMGYWDKVGAIQDLIRFVGLSVDDQNLYNLGGDERAELSRIVRERGLKDGGIVTRETMRLLGEAGPEAVIPLKNMGQMGFGGGGNTFNVSFPNITSFGQFSVSEAERMIKNSLLKAAENLNRAGYRWPMQTKEV